MMSLESEKVVFDSTLTDLGLIYRHINVNVGMETFAVNFSSLVKAIHPNTAKLHVLLGALRRSCSSERRFHIIAPALYSRSLVYCSTDSFVTELEVNSEAPRMHCRMRFHAVTQSTTSRINTTHAADTANIGPEKWEHQECVRAA